MSSSINSFDIKLGNTNCGLTCATITTEWSSLSVDCLNEIDEDQFVCPKELRKKAFAKRMKSRRMEEEKCYLREEAALMIMEDENEDGGSSWKEDNRKKTTKLDAMREIKHWKAKWENEREEEERRSYAGQRQWKLEEIKKQQLGIIDEYEKTKEEANKLKFKWTNAGKKNYGTTENNLAYKIEEGDWAYLVEGEYILGKSIEVIPSAADSDLVDVLTEIKCDGTQQANARIYISGSWDNWKGQIPMKYSSLTKSFLAVLSLPISKDEYELLFFHSNPNRCCWFYNVNYPTRNPPNTLSNECKNWKVNFVKLNSITQIGHQNSSWKQNKDVLNKILKADNSMVKLENRMKNNEKLRFPEWFVNKIKHKYLEIRNALSLEINPQKVKSLIYEADRAHTYLELIFLVLYDWQILEKGKGSRALKKCENAKEIRVEYVNMLKQFMMSKEEIIHQFKYNFCHPLLRECCRCGLKYKSSKEIQQLNAFLNADFSHNNLLT